MTPFRRPACTIIALATLALALNPARAQTTAPVAETAYAPARVVTPVSAQQVAQQQIAQLRAQMTNTIARIQQIVNQPVRRIRLTRSMHYSTYPEGWFHPGANKPDFNHIDVRTTQETPYAPYQYVTSPLNPGIVFYGPDLEFNANTKYFITDRTQPKKKLTDGEMIEINSLYRVLGKCEAEIAQLSRPAGIAVAGQPATTAPGKAAVAALQKETPVPETDQEITVTTTRQPAPAKGIDPSTGHLMVGGLGAILAVLVVRRFMK